MFGKKKVISASKPAPKNTVKFSPKVAEADKLRLAARRAGKEYDNLRNKAYSEFHEAKTDAQKKKIRDRYANELKQLKFKASKAESSYGAYIKGNFNSGDVDKLLRPKGNNDLILSSYDKKFIRGLQASEDAIKKAKKKSNNSVTTRITSAKTAKCKRSKK